MPLSEHEERILAEIERQLAEEDPGFVARARKATGSEAGGRLRLALVGIVLGIVAMAGLTFHVAYGVVGFAVLLLSTVTAISALRQKQAHRPQARNDSR